MPTTSLAIGLASVLAFPGLAQETGTEAPRPQAFPDPVVELPDEPVVLPMSMRLHTPAVEVWVNGEGPFAFAIDTGASGMARVDSALIEELGLEVVGSVQGGDPTGRAPVQMPVARLDTLEVGGAVFRNVHAPSRSYARVGLPIQGFLGIHLFANSVLTLDRPGQEVRIERGPLRAPAGARLLEITTPADYVPGITMELGGQELELLIDTGKTGGLLVPKDVFDSLTLIGEPTVVGKARTITGELTILQAEVAGTLRIGSIVVENPTVETNELLPTAIVGGGFLADYVLTIDQASRRVWLRTPEEERSLRAPQTGR